jgi:hypothetical protein
MKTSRRSASVLLAAFAGAVLCLAPALRAQEAHWSYSGEDGRALGHALDRPTRCAGRKRANRPST